MQEALPIYDKAFFIDMKNKPLFLTIGTLVLLAAVLDVTTLSVKADKVDLFEQQKLASHVLINLLLERIDQGDLVVFEQALTKTDLQPHQVSYVHNLLDDSLLVRLSFKLQKKIFVPDFKDFCVDRITIETDEDGNVLQVISHVSPLKEGSSE